MASGRITCIKQETSRSRMELTKIGMRGKTNDPLSLPLASSSSQGESNLMEKSQESTEHSSHEYDDIKRYSPGFNIPHKNNNTIHPQHSKVDLQAHLRGNQNIKSTECWRDSNKDLLALKVTLGIILVVSLISLVLVVLDVVGAIGPNCVCNSNIGSAKQCKDNLQPNVSTTFLLKRIDMLEKNISSLVLQLKFKYGGNSGNDSSGGKNGNGEHGGNGGNKENSSSLSSIATEVKKLREKQVQLDSSLTKLKESGKTKATDIQEMSAKVVGLAVAVNFLSANDSLIKSKVRKLSQTDLEFRSSLEALKKKDAEVDVSLRKAKGVEAFLNSSVSQLKFVDGQLKNKVDQLSTKFLIKINSINSTVHTMQGGGAGPPGPPGPQGPRGVPGTPGAGNVTQCQHQQKTFEGSSGRNVAFFVKFLEPKDKIVVGATCSTIRGDETNLSTGTNSRGEKVYLCTCRGQSNYARASRNMKCLIDVWMCPRIS